MAAPRGAGVCSSFFCADVKSDDTTIEVVVADIAPTCLFHNIFQGGRFREGRKRIGQVVVFFEGLAKDCAEERGELIKVEIEKSAKDFARGVANFQADHASAGANNA